MPTRNFLLSSLPERDLARLRTHFRPHKTTFGEELHCRANSDPDVFFPFDSVSSLVVQGLEGGTIEVATVGNEGMVGLPVFIESEAVAIDAVTHVPGEGVRMPRKILARELARKEMFSTRLQEYCELVLLQAGQAGFCSRTHTQVQRCARWLLSRDDRSREGKFSLTHDFLARMLGTRRATVTLAAADLQKHKLIAYRRGEFHILDRDGLEGVACECYAHIRSEFTALRRRWTTRK